MPVLAPRSMRSAQSYESPEPTARRTSPAPTPPSPAGASPIGEAPPTPVPSEPPLAGAETPLAPLAPPVQRKARAKGKGKKQSGKNDRTTKKPAVAVAPAAAAVPASCKKKPAAAGKVQERYREREINMEALQKTDPCR